MIAGQILFLIGWLFLLLVVGAGAWRLAAGPTTLDRLVGFDTATIGVIALLTLFSAYEGTGDYLELILVIAALGFFTTVAYFYYLARSAPESEDFTDPKEESR